MKRRAFISIAAVMLMHGSVVWAQEAVPAVPAPVSAPAVPSASKDDWRVYKNPYVGEENDLANPHRTTQEITAWAQQTTTEVLSFGKADYRERITGFKKYFVSQGWQPYAAYLKESGLIEMASKNGYTISTIVSDAPEIINQGAAAGAYHWIIRMPITTGLSAVTPEGKTIAGSSRKYTLVMDIGRVADGGGTDGIAISGWTITAR